jgi:hypothetical protein
MKVDAAGRPKKDGRVNRILVVFHFDRRGKIVPP